MVGSEKPKPLPLQVAILYGATNWLLFTAGVLNLGTGTWAAMKGDAALAATSLTAGLVLLFAATIDRFESIKGLGIEAKTRVLDEKIAQADVALGRLRELSELTGGALIDMQSKVGRWDSAPTPRDAREFAEKVRATLKALGSDEASISGALRPWATTLASDLTRMAVAPMSAQLRKSVAELEKLRSALPQPIPPDHPEFMRLSRQIERAMGLVEAANRISSGNLDDLPDRLGELAEQVAELPGVDAESYRPGAERLSRDLRLLGATMVLPNVDDWIEALTAWRRRADR